MTAVANSFEPAGKSEPERLAALHRYGMLDTPPDGTFDRITALAADLFSVPISIVSLVDHDRIWFKSHHGLETQQIGRDPGLCVSAILNDETLLLPDARKDLHALANPLVAGEFGLRFYAGAPLRTHDGYNLGTLCVIAKDPRNPHPKLISQLQVLASLVMDQMELRLAARSAVMELSKFALEKDEALKQAQLLKKEIDHRVMNSLQMVSSVLQLQSRDTEDPGATVQLEIASRRIYAIAQAHKHIYTTERIGTTSCDVYFTQLCADLSQALQSDGRRAIVVQSQPVQLSTNQIVPLGLIVNELVINSVKHGAGDIRVSMDVACADEADKADEYALSVSDEGKLPEDFDITRTRGLGMKLVRAMVTQISGRLTVAKSSAAGGAKFTIRFSRKD